MEEFELSDFIDVYGSGVAKMATCVRELEARTKELETAVKEHRKKEFCLSGNNSKAEKALWSVLDDRGMS